MIIIILKYERIRIFQSLPLYLVANAFKLGLITAEEKRKIKEIIIANSPEDKFFINNIIMDYNKNGILQNVITQFLSLVYNTNTNLNDSSLSNSTLESEENISSPMDTLLIKYKKEKNNHIEQNTIIRLYSVSNEN